MTYFDLRIQLDLLNGDCKSFLDNYSPMFMTDDMNYFVVCDSGDCHLFNKNGKELDIKSVSIIEDMAFYNCTSLTSIDLPDSVESIGYGAFADCTSLTSVEIPDSVKSIRDEAFSHCTSLTSINIPDNAKSIGYGAFYECTSLTSVEIPESVKSIGNWAFEYCTSLTSIMFEGKTLDEVKRMEYYPWGIVDESSIIACKPVNNF